MPGQEPGLAAEVLELLTTFELLPFSVEDVPPDTLFKAAESVQGIKANHGPRSTCTPAAYGLLFSVSCEPVAAVINAYMRATRPKLWWELRHYSVVEGVNLLQLTARPC
jgi:hypothetical protein